MIDTSLGVTLGISTMCAAAIGNIVSDVAGVLLGTMVEDFCSRYLNLPTYVSHIQMESPAQLYRTLYSGLLMSHYLSHLCRPQTSANHSTAPVDLCPLCESVWVCRWFDYWMHHRDVSPLFHRLQQDPGTETGGGYGFNFSRCYGGGI